MVSSPALGLQAQFRWGLKGKPGARRIWSCLEGLQWLDSSDLPDTNNSTELEGLIQDFECLIDGGWLPAIIKGDTNILIQMERGLENGKTSKKISTG